MTDPCTLIVLQAAPSVSVYYFDESQIDCRYIRNKGTIELTFVRVQPMMLLPLLLLPHSGVLQT